MIDTRDRMAGAAAPRGRVRADSVYLGWQQAFPKSDPGPPPTPPDEGEPDEVSQDWLAAQRREQRRLARPAAVTGSASLAVAAAVAATWLAGLLNLRLALLAGPAALLIAAACGRELWRGSAALAAQLRAEEQRVAKFREVQRAQLAARQRQYAQQHRSWQRHSAAHRRQPQWYPVTVPTSVHRVDVAGGTLAGWSALLTMIATPRLAVGGAVTVIDLTEGGVAADLLAVARRAGIDPLVWVLPADLPRLELGTDLSQDLQADVLALTVAAADGPGSEVNSGPADPARDPARDAALLNRVLRAVGDGSTMAQLIAALRALGQIGGPDQHLGAGELTPDQLSRLANMAGRGAERLVIERAWAIEARLRALAPLAADPSGRNGSLQVAWLDRRSAAVANGTVAAYLAVALTAVLRQSPAGRPWQQTICMLGAERLPGDVLDRLCAAAELARAGLVLGYRSIPPQVRDRLGRGNAAVAFMRLGNAEDARLATEQIGTEHRFMISQLTDTVGTSVTETSGDAYTSTVGTADSVTDSGSATLTAGRSRGRGHSGQGSFAPFADFTGSASRDASTSAAWSDSRSVTEGISTSTSWGVSTSRAVGTSSSLAGTLQRSRELVIEPHELQHLPQTTVVLCRPGPGGRAVLLADANPAIMALPTATLAALPDPATAATARRLAGPV